MSCLIHWGRLCDIIVIDAHVPTEESFYKEFEQTFDQYPRYHVEMLLCDFEVKVRQEDILKLTIRKESVHKLVIITVLGL